MSTRPTSTYCEEARSVIFGVEAVDAQVTERQAARIVGMARHLDLALGGNRNDGRGEDAETLPIVIGVHASRVGEGRILSSQVQA